MTRIVLIQPPRPHNANTSAEANWQLTRPFSLFSLAAAFLRQTGVDVKIVDLEKKEYAGEKPENVLADYKAEIFGVTATTYTRFSAIHLIKVLRRLNPNTLIVVGGVHFGYSAEDALIHVPEIDVVVRGEGEISLVELSKAVADNIPFSSVKGISFLDGTRIIHNPSQEKVVELDSQPTYDNFTWQEYPEYVFGFPGSLPAISVMSSRGCPYRCIFCSKRQSKYRLRNVASVCDEITEFKKRFGILGINFLDLTLTAQPRHVKALCREMIVRKLDMKWWCESRANIPLELLSEMKSAGCVAIALGVESGSPRVLRKIGKDITVNQVKAFCHEAKRLGIDVQCYFSYSHPGETVADVKRTLKLMGELDEYAKSYIQPMMIFPGTELEIIARKTGVLRPDFSWYEPYEEDLNIELGQLPNVPLFLDKLPVEFMKQIQQQYIQDKAERATEREYLAIYSKLTFRQIAEKAFRRIVQRRDGLPKFLNWRFIGRALAYRKGKVV